MFIRNLFWYVLMASQTTPQCGATGISLYFSWKMAPNCPARTPERSVKAFGLNALTCGSGWRSYLNCMWTCCPAGPSFRGLKSMIDIIPSSWEKMKIWLFIIQSYITFWNWFGFALFFPTSHAFILWDIEWSTTRASVTPLSRQTPHSRSASVVVDFWETKVPASPTEVETQTRKDESFLRIHGMAWLHGCPSMTKPLMNHFGSIWESTSWYTSRDIFV